MGRRPRRRRWEDRCVGATDRRRRVPTWTATSASGRARRPGGNAAAAAQGRPRRRRRRRRPRRSRPPSKWPLPAPRPNYAAPPSLSSFKVKFGESNINNTSNSI